MDIRAIALTADKYTGLTPDGSYRVVYTDGGCENNGLNDVKRFAGVGVWFAEDCKLNGALPFTWSNPTNNRAELMAVILAMSGYTAFIATEQDYRVRHLVIFTDSKYVVDIARPGGNRRHTNFDMWNLFDKTLRLTQATGCQIHILWIKGHNDSYGNIQADALATRGIMWHKKLHDLGCIKESQDVKQ
ncbi:hypothetical protein HDV02_002476 [Globomyces sp. JEL0801]|nr:hypothetical protein HDV02_002476 [Globomyces sp. JEL0801]